MNVSQPAVVMQKKIDQIHRAVYAVAGGIEQLLKSRNKIAVYNCSVCDCDLYPGNACIDVTRRVEQPEIIDGQHSNTVIDADVLAIFCADCGNLFAHAGHWRRNLGLALGLNEDDLQAAGADTCDHCLGRIYETDARVVVEVMISQIDETSAGRISHTPITDEIFLAFCSCCGNNMSRERIQAAVDGLLRPNEGEG